MGWEEILGETPEYDIEFMVEHIKALPDDAVIVELGALVGRTTVAIALASLGTNRKIYTVDNFDVKAHKAQGGWVEPSRVVLEKNLADNNVADLVTIIEDNTYEVGLNWKSPPVDCLIHDASHRYGDVCKDLRIWLPHVKIGGLIFMHDYGNAFCDVQRVCLEILGQPDNQCWLTGLWVKK